MPPSSVASGKSAIGSFARKLFTPRFIKLAITIIAIFNIFYVSLYLIDEKSGKHIKSKLKSHASVVLDNFYNQNGPEENAPVVNHTPNTNTISEQHDDLPLESNQDSSQDKLYQIPDKPYSELNDHERILHRLNEVTLDKKKYWLAHTELTDVELEINIKEFLKEHWVSNPTVFYDPRFTLSIYLNEIKNQYLEKNPKNEKDKGHEIVVPFSWSDWVDLDMLNEEFRKPQESRKTCEYLKLTHHIPAQDPNYCINSYDVTQEDLEEMNLPSTEFLPGFAVKKSPTNKASNEVRMLEGKAHLLTYAKNPLKMNFLSRNGIYEANIDGKQRLVDSDLFETFLQRKNIQNYDAKFILNPVKEFEDLLNSVEPTPLGPEDDAYGMSEKIKEKDETKSRQLYLPESAFDYQQDKVESQINEYETRLNLLKDLTTNELHFDEQTINQNKLSRNERMYYNGLKYANSFPADNEETYFRMARLNFDSNDKYHDAGWHYEWRFFNGAMRYLKKGWNREELIIRDKVLLDRIFRNWFKFTAEKGIISWIAHGTLLAWYWDGLLFPFDEDIDIQMPVEELARLSKLYNQTLIVEDINEGFGKYFIDCSTFLHHRTETKNQNHIDARFIDIDTGSYIDITGIGISDEQAPEKYNSIVEAAAQEGKPKPVYNCRHLHFTSYNEASPLKYTMLGGVPLYIPNNIESILKDEYLEGMSSYTYRGYYYVDKMNLWIHGLNLTFLFEEDPMIKQNFKHSDGKLIEDRFTELVKEMDDAKVLKLIENNEDILLEYYLSKDVTDIHKRELSYIFNMPNGVDSLMSEVKSQLPSEELDTNVDYHKLTSTFKFRKPFRRPLFNYEYIDRPNHHVEHPE